MKSPLHPAGRSRRLRHAAAVVAALTTVTACGGGEPGGRDPGGRDPDALDLQPTYACSNEVRSGETVVARKLSGRLEAEVIRQLSPEERPETFRYSFGTLDDFHHVGPERPARGQELRGVRTNH